MLYPLKSQGPPGNLWEPQGTSRRVDFRLTRLGNRTNMSHSQFAFLGVSFPFRQKRLWLGYLIMQTNRFALSFLLSAAVVFGQIGSSTITGRVTDASGAVAPNVAVTVVNTDTNFSYTATTNADGI